MIIIFASNKNLHHHGELAITPSFLSLVLWNSHGANLEKERHTPTRGRPAPLDMRWSRIGLESIIFTKTVYMQKYSIILCKKLVYILNSSIIFAKIVLDLEI